jgi:hypothetical protein
MAAGESGHRQRFVPDTKHAAAPRSGLARLDPNPSTCRSGIPTSNNSLEHYDRRPRERIETSYQAPTMATALISPNTPYHHQHHNSFSSGYPHSAPTTGMPGMISPVEPRRPSGDSDHGHPHRQSLPSLPSISEVFSERKSLGGYAATPPHSAPMPPAPGLPSPFTSGPPSRPFSDVTSPDRNPSPRTMHPTSTFPRAEALPAFSDPARPSLASRPVPPPLNTFPGQQPSPPVKYEQLEAEQRHAEAQALSAGHRPQPPQPLPSMYTETARLPPGQLPLSAYPISPRHQGPPLPSPYDSRGPPAYGEEGDYANLRPSDYKANFDKHFQANGYQDALQSVRFSSAVAEAEDTRT